MRDADTTNHTSNNIFYSLRGVSSEILTEVLYVCRSDLTIKREERDVEVFQLGLFSTNVVTFTLTTTSREVSYNFINTFNLGYSRYTVVRCEQVNIGDKTVLTWYDFQGCAKIDDLEIIRAYFRSCFWYWISARFDRWCDELGFDRFWV